MARIRSVKPELRTDLTVAAWPIPVRYAWVLLWGYLDDHGRGRDDMRLVVADLFPLDRSVTEKKVNDWLTTMSTVKAEDDTEPPLCRYEVAGQHYLHAVNWEKHQRVSHARDSSLPPCPIHDDLTNDSGKPPEYDRNDSGKSPEVLRPHARGGEQGAGRGAGNEGAGIPTTSGATAIAPTDKNAASIVKAYVDGATSAGLPRPGEGLRGKVGKQAKRLLEREGIPSGALLVAAKSMGARGWDDLERELQRVAATQTPRGRPSTTDGAVADVQAIATELREAGL